MPFIADGKLRVFILNVGQADTSIIITPKGKVIIIDAVSPRKTVNLLNQLGLKANSGVTDDKEEIDELIITHPHKDHFSAANRLLSAYNIRAVNLAPYWFQSCIPYPQYLEMLNRIESADIPLHFVSGYLRLCPDGIIRKDDSGHFSFNKNLPFLELLGPSNSILEKLEEAEELNMNHLSIMTRLSWGKFRMVFAADAQMENWAHFDREGMLSKKCNILKAAHHGSCNGTQFERLERLKPGCVIVSSDPTYNHHLPDIIGAASFKKYEKNNGKLVVLTNYTGTIKIEVDDSGKVEKTFYSEKRLLNINFNNGKKLTRRTNPTDWKTVLEYGIKKLLE